MWASSKFEITFRLSLGVNICSGHSVLQTPSLVTQYFELKFLIFRANASAFLAHLSCRLTRWAYSIPMVHCPSVVHTFKLEYLWRHLANLDQILCVASLVWGKGWMHKVLGQIGSKLWFPWHRKPPLTYNGENNVSTFSRLFLIRSFLYLQMTRTCIKSRTSSNLGQIGPLTTELAALERLKSSHRLIMGKYCLHASSIFDRIIIKVAGNQDRHKSSDEFDFGRIRLLPLEFLALERRKFTFELEYLWGQLANLDQILCVASLRVGKGCIMFWGRLDQNSDVHGNRKPPLTYNGENGVSTTSRLLLIDPFYTCR